VKSFLADDILFKTDRASMAASLEARVPYLDHELVRVRLQDSGRLQAARTGGEVDPAPRVRGRIPEMVLRRRKSGFPFRSLHGCAQA